MGREGPNQEAFAATEHKIRRKRHCAEHGSGAAPKWNLSGQNSAKGSAHEALQPRMGTVAMLILKGVLVGPARLELATLCLEAIRTSSHPSCRYLDFQQLGASAFAQPTSSEGSIQVIVIRF